MDRVKDFLAWLLRSWIKKHEQQEVEQSYVSWTSYYGRLEACLSGFHDACEAYVRDPQQRCDVMCTCSCHPTAPIILSK